MASRLGCFSHDLQATQACWSSYSNRSQSTWAEFGVTDSVPDVSMSEKLLDEAGIQFFFGKEIARRMTQHVRVGCHVQTGLLSGLTHNVAEGASGQGATTLGHEDILAVAILSHGAEVPDLITVECV